MQFKTLTKDNYVMYAMKAYDNPQCSCLGEFDNDLARITYIKRLFKKYISTDILKERLIINHIVIMTNVLVQRSQHDCYFSVWKNTIMQ